MKTRQNDPSGPVGRAPVRPEELAGKLRAIRNYESATPPEELTAAPRRLEMLAHIQAMSLRPGGLLKFVEQLLAEFPERLGTPTLRAAGQKPLTLEQKRQIYFEMPNGNRPYVKLPASYLRHDLSPEDCARLQRENSKALRNALAALGWEDFLKICRNAALSKLPDYLAALCTDRNTDFSGKPSPEDAADELLRCLGGDENGERPAFAEADSGLARPIPWCWFFDNVQEAVVEMIDREAARVQKRLAMTEVTKLVFETLDYALAERVMARVEGNSRFGKTESLKTYCQMRPGLLRYVQTPASNSISDLVRKVAEALGMDTSYGSSTAGLRARIEFILGETGLGLVLDEAQFLVPQNYGAATAPQRLNWVRMEIVNRGLPLVMASTPQTFQPAIDRYVKKTRYTMEQFMGRLCLTSLLPQVLSEGDLLAVGRIHFPELGENALGYIANEARLSENYLQAVEAIAHYARFLAGRNGGRVTVKILETAVARVIPRRALSETDLPTQESPRESLNGRRCGQSLTAAQRGINPLVVETAGEDFSSSSLRGAGPDRTLAEPVLAES